MKKMVISIFAWGVAGLITISMIVRIIRLIESQTPLQELFFKSDNLIWILVLPIFGIMAALIVSRQPSNAIGWLLFLPATTNLLDLEPYIRSFNPPPEHPPVWLYLALFYYGTAWLQLIFPLFFIPVLFPTGRPPSPRWRWLISFGLGMIAVFLFLVVFNQSLAPIDSGLDWVITNPIGFIPFEVFGDIFDTVWTAGLVVMAVSSVISLIYRYRHAAVEERKQIRWLLYACALFVATYLVVDPITTHWPGTLLSDLAGLVWGLSFTGFPISIAISILRHRLWDIDLIIRRTLVYGLLSGSLVLIYLGGVTLLQWLFTAISGQQSPVSVVVSTLAIAALFTPLRRGIQTAIDRRFYREKYDAEQAAASFALTTRSEVDQLALTDRLVEVVAEAVQPESITLWLRKENLN